MPLTKLDGTAALVVIDLQKGVVGMPTAHPAGEIIGRTVQLARAFRERGLPSFLSMLRAGLRAAPRPALPNCRFRRIGPSSFLNWSGNPAIIS
jgi:hypothetical protein